MAQPRPARTCACGAISHLVGNQVYTLLGNVHLQAAVPLYLMRYGYASRMRDFFFGACNECEDLSHVKAGNLCGGAELIAPRSRANFSRSSYHGFSPSSHIQIRSAFTAQCSAEAIGSTRQRSRRGRNDQRQLARAA